MNKVPMNPGAYLVPRPKRARTRNVSTPARTLPDRKSTEHKSVTLRRGPPT